MTRRKDPSKLKISRIKVPGHGLLGNGAAYAASRCMEDDCLVFYHERVSQPGTTSGIGHAGCECGARGPHVSSQRARRRWYDEHRAELLAKMFGQMDSEDAA